MRKPSILLTKSMAVMALMLSASSLFAQSADNSNLVVYSLVVIGVLLVLGVVMQVSDNLLQIEAQKQNVQHTGMGIFPRIQGVFSKSLPKDLRDKEVHVLRRGFDIRLEGEASGDIHDADAVTRYAVQPPNWRGIAPIPKLYVKVGDIVKAGQPVFFDKQNPDIQFVAPVSGEVIEVNRGEKRAITEVVILADKEQVYESFEVPDIESANREELVEFLCKTGGWTLIDQRPFNVLPGKDVEPANIFISTFDSAPLAPDLNKIIEGRGPEFQKGLDVLTKLTHGKVHLGLDGRDGRTPASEFVNAAGVEKHYFRGPHPCGNVGIQIHHIAPITPAFKVWTLGVQDVITLGGLFLNGEYDATRIIALTGEPLDKRIYVKTKAGANISELLKGIRVNDNTRLISGDVLSGEKKSADGYLNMFDDQITGIAEGDDYDMFGWLVPNKALPSVSNTYPNFLFPDMQFVPDTNTRGEKRAFVVTGQYEKMLPMDIYPQHLMKAIMVQDFEKMEGLGIYELSEEDIALCEFACTSKQPLQHILREGLELMREQG